MTAPAFTLRPYDPARDAAAVRELSIALQDFERAIDPRVPPGIEMVDAYVELMFRRSREYDGEMLVAVIDGAVVGFVSVWKRFRSSEPDDPPTEHGFVSDLVVAERERGRGIGRALLREAEARVRATGARSLALSLKAGNTGARALYTAEGFGETEVWLEKRFDR